MKNKIIISFFIALNMVYAECYELNQSDCLYWSQYCEWNDETGQCQEIGGGGGGGDGSDDGPYQYATVTESQGLRNGPDYRDGVLYYPTDGNPPFKSVIITPGFGGGSSSMSSWGAFFASHGFTALIIGPNDEINDSHQQRGEGLIDGIETVRQENNRSASPLYGLIDTESFTVSGYSMGGGASHNAALMDSSIKAVISLNPTVLFENCDVCPEEFGYCICLVPEVIEHYIPSLIFAGEFEINELEAYAGLLGQDVYANLPSETQKIMFEGAGGGHGSAYSPSGEVSEYILSFMNYFVLEDDSYCESLLETPSSASQYLTNIVCEDSVQGDVNGDALVNVQDVVLVVNLVLSASYDSAADLNSDGIINVLDIVQVVNIILN
tara:strand:+ start:619 stop:1761 length:1143 start_codon:yes stop_codon:yes gene_type:complete